MKNDERLTGGYMITLIGEITDETTKDFIDELLALTGNNISILIDSIGGDEVTDYLL